MADALEQRIKDLEDRLDLQQLFIDYGRYLDAGDFDGYASCFAPDGVVNLGPVGRAEGPEEIKELMRKTLEGRTGNSYHLITSPLFTIDGDTATSSVMWTVIQRDGNDQPVLTMVGRHEDEIVRTDAGWKFRRRKGLIDIPAKHPDA